MSKVLEYSEFRHFKPVIEKAKVACKNSGQNIDDHFEDFLEMVQIGSNAMRPFDDGIKLSRYACYLIVQNADPSKEIVANGQTYFAIQTRIQEIQQQNDYEKLTSDDERRLFLRRELKKHNIQLADAAKDAGVVKPVEYAIFQNHGYKGLYGGLDAKAIHVKKGLKQNQNILDHMGSTELAANLFRATQTEEKLRRENIVGKSQANKAHFDVGKKVRQTIEELGGVMPENLPTEESVKKLESREKDQGNSLFVLFDGVSSFDDSIDLVKECKKYVSSWHQIYLKKKNGLQHLIYNLNLKAVKLPYNGKTTCSVLLLDYKSEKALVANVGD